MINQPFISYFTIKMILNSQTLSYVFGFIQFMKLCKNIFFKMNRDNIIVFHRQFSTVFNEYIYWIHNNNMVITNHSIFVERMLIEVWKCLEIAKIFIKLWWRFYWKFWSLFFEQIIKFLFFCWKDVKWTSLIRLTIHKNILV